MSRMFCLLLAATAGFLGVEVARCAGQDNPPPKRDRAQLEQPQMRVANVSPRLREILENWEQASGKIKKLEGTHTRFVYDNTFNTAKQSVGHFYYEAPDKGRIDIEPAKVTPGAKTKRTNRDTKQPYDLTADTAEIWIADGMNVLQIKPTAKTAELWEIPEAKRGANIMDGPLPFLFGLPADEALERFDFELITEEFGPKRDHIHLMVKPRWESDASNWSQASILLNKHTYLPAAVELTDPAGSMITVYSFEEFKVNQKQTFFKLFQRDPFKYPLSQYQVQVHTADAQPAQASGPAGPPGSAPVGMNRSVPEKPANVVAAADVPSVVGLPYPEASKTLEDLGFRVELKPGSLARNAKELFTVERQHQQGPTVFLYLYDKPRNANAQSPQSRTAAKPGADDVQ